MAQLTPAQSIFLRAFDDYGNGKIAQARDEVSRARQLEDARARQELAARALSLNMAHDAEMARQRYVQSEKEMAARKEMNDADNKAASARLKEEYRLRGLNEIERVKALSKEKAEAEANDLIEFTGIAPAEGEDLRAFILRAGNAASEKAGATIDHYNSLNAALDTRLESARLGNAKSQMNLARLAAGQEFSALLDTSSSKVKQVLTELLAQKMSPDEAVQVALRARKLTSKDDVAEANKLAYDYASKVQGYAAQLANEKSPAYQQIERAVNDEKMLNTRSLNTIQNSKWGQKSIFDRAQKRSVPGDSGDEDSGDEDSGDEGEAAYSALASASPPPVAPRAHVAGPPELNSMLLPPETVGPPAPQEAFTKLRQDLREANHGRAPQWMKPGQPNSMYTVWNGYPEVQNLDRRLTDAADAAKIFQIPGEQIGSSAFTKRPRAVMAAKPSIFLPRIEALPPEQKNALYIQALNSFQKSPHDSGPLLDWEYQRPTYGTNQPPTPAPAPGVFPSFSLSGQPELRAPRTEMRGVLPVAAGTNRFMLPPQIQDMPMDGYLEPAPVTIPQSYWMPQRRAVAPALPASAFGTNQFALP